MEEMQEVNEVLAQGLGMGDMDESEFEDEFAALGECCWLNHGQLSSLRFFRSLTNRSLDDSLSQRRGC